MPTGMINCIGKSPRGLNPTQRTIDDEGRLGALEIFFLREEHADRLSYSKGKALKTYMQVTFYSMNWFSVDA